MSDHLPVLKVRLFGGFSASYGEIPVSFGRNTTTKAMKLLQILLNEIVADITLPWRYRYLQR